jgi:alginate O-acetyltransferase complex protein AlgI
MIETSTLLILLGFVAVALSWMVPATFALDVVAAWTALVLAVLAPASAAWLLATALLTPLMLQAGERTGHRNFVAGLWAAVLIAAFVAARFTTGVLWIGGAFFTLRALHVVGDWWMGRLAVPSLRAHLRYQFFLPVIAAGPIDRFETFERQATRRRWDAPLFLEGMERTLLGAFSTFVIAGWGIEHARDALALPMQQWNGFLRDWGISVAEWVSLYFVFSGFSSIALGLSLMIGLRLEENFDRPWAARTLIDFWMRWHMTLTGWCRDYVFRPVTALSRSALVGLFAAMLAVGLWHEFSAYYVLWAGWQVLGVVLTRLAMRHFGFDRVPSGVSAVFGPLFVLSWLSLARPVLSRLLELVP